jgi:hypothetical protein
VHAQYAVQRLEPLGDGRMVLEAYAALRRQFHLYVHVFTASFPAAFQESYPVPYEGIFNYTFHLQMIVLQSV